MNKLSSTPSLFSAVSALSGASLASIGGASLILSLFFFSLSGIAVSLAVTGHGVYELRVRNRFLTYRKRSYAVQMVRNQILLAVSISLYALWQAWTFNPELLATLMSRPEAKAILQLYPYEFRMRIPELLPRFVWIFYLMLIAVAWMGCGATAYYYRTKSLGLIREDDENLSDIAVL